MIAVVKLYGCEWPSDWEDDNIGNGGPLLAGAWWSVFLVILFFLLCIPLVLGGWIGIIIVIDVVPGKRTIEVTVILDTC